MFWPAKDAVCGWFSAGILGSEDSNSRVEYLHYTLICKQKFISVL